MFVRTQVAPNMKGHRLFLISLAYLVPNRITTRVLTKQKTLRNLLSKRLVECIDDPKVELELETSIPVPPVQGWQKCVLLVQVLSM